MNDDRYTKYAETQMLEFQDLLAALNLLRDDLEQMQFLLPKLLHSDNLFEIQYYIMKEVLPFLQSIKGIMDRWLNVESV